MQLIHPAPLRTGQAWDSASNRQVFTNLWESNQMASLIFLLAFYEVKKRKRLIKITFVYIKELRIIWSLAIFFGGVITDIYVNWTIHFCKNGLKYIVFVFQMNAHLPFMNLIHNYKVNIFDLMKSVKEFSHFSFCMKSHLSKKITNFRCCLISSSFLKR